jgi:cytoskeleton protein RodZ
VTAPEGVTPASNESASLEPSPTSLSEAPVEPAPKTEAAGPEATTLEAAATDVAAEAAVAPASDYGEPGGRITITAAADSWIEIRGPNNEVLFTRTLHAGEVYRVPDRAGLRLTTGNAGGLEIRVDGRLTPPLGGTGIVRRNVPLDPVVLVERTPPQP